MTSISIPARIMYISYAFFGCNALATVQYGGTQLDLDGFMASVEGLGYESLIKAAKTFQASGRRHWDQRTEHGRHEQRNHHPQTGGGVTSGSCV